MSTPRYHMQETLALAESALEQGELPIAALVVLDDRDCMVDISRFFLRFTCGESCGKCTFCRIGTRRMLEVLDRLCEGRGGAEDLDNLEELADKVSRNSLCGLGQTAPNPVLTTIRYFKEEYLSHIRDQRCPAGVCRALIKFTIDSEACTGCTACVKACPSEAISGDKKKVHVIEQAKCIQCGACYEVCKFKAVQRT